MILEINNLYKVIVKVNEGSGILLKFEADKKCYVLTAYHNIEDYIEDYEKIELFNDNNAPYVIVEKPYFDINNDIALLEVDYIIQDIPIITFERSIKPDDLIIFMGYPDKSEGIKEDLSGEVGEWNETKTAIKVIKNVQGSTIQEEKTIEVFVGFSGSGVFKKDGQKLSLIGILKSLHDQEFYYKEIYCVPIAKIFQFIQDKNLAEITFSNPLASALSQLQPTDKRNLEEKLKVCPTLRSAKIKQYIRIVTIGQTELSRYDERELSSIKYSVFEECQEELMDFIDNYSNNNELKSEDIKQLIEKYTQRAKKIIDDKRNEYGYGVFSDDIIKKIILDLIETCYLSFDEEGIYE